MPHTYDRVYFGFIYGKDDRLVAMAEEAKRKDWEHREAMGRVNRVIRLLQEHFAATGHVMPVRDMAKESRFSLNEVREIYQGLVQAGYLRSTKGGYIALKKFLSDEVSK